MRSEFSNNLYTFVPCFNKIYKENMLKNRNVNWRFNYCETIKFRLLTIEI
jgi:hypothetical protein